MGNLGVPEILIIVLVLLVFFGAKKIPEMAQGLGKGIREFKKATREIQTEENAPAVEATTAKVSCPFCRSEISKDAKFCPSCGKSTEPIQCSKCGTINPVGNKFCSDCGEKLAV